MSLIQYFSIQPGASDIPDRLRNPFDNNPHTLAILASKELQQRLIDLPHITEQLFEKNNGKMFGVLVVSDAVGKIGYLSGFSGLLNQQWEMPGFVPPVFNDKQQQKFLQQGEKQVTELTGQIELLVSSPDRLQAKSLLKQLKQQQDEELAEFKKQNKKNKKCRKEKRETLIHDLSNMEVLQKLSFQSQQDKRDFKQLKLSWDKKILETKNNFYNDFESSIEELITKRKKLSQQLHKKVFDSYQLMNKLKQVNTLNYLFDGKTPPGGTGDCAAPKLIQYAHENNFKILAMAEFWWGDSPLKGVRQHARFYPPCRGKCFPILPFMLTGIISQKINAETNETLLVPEIVYEDENLLVLDKPAGMLSIPGKQQEYSVLSWLKKRYPEAEGALLVHRLDMATSGLLVAAKNSKTHKHLQKQFIHRNVKKRYVSVLSKVLSQQKLTVDLPLRVDLDDRPRQLVCSEFGKPALTHVEVISNDKKTTRVHFYPVTGRTHQLRVHAAHSQGLDAPIVGDELYGSRSTRLMLHAEKISFEHPVTGVLMEIKSKAPF